VSLEQGACAHCGAAVSVLDADAVEKAVRALSAAPAKAVQSEPVRRPTAYSPQSMEKLRGRMDTPLLEPGGPLYDLFENAIGEVVDWLSD
jgi:hypothetical protein